jgi:hypothetical protein
MGLATHRDQELVAFDPGAVFQGQPERAVAVAPHRHRLGLETNVNAPGAERLQDDGRPERAPGLCQLAADDPTAQDREPFGNPLGDGPFAVRPGCQLFQAVQGRHGGAGADGDNHGPARRQNVV